MTITSGRSSKYLLNQSMAAAWTSAPIRIATVNGVFFQLLILSGTPVGTIHTDVAVDWNDNASSLFTPMVWSQLTQPQYTWVITAGLFANGRTDSTSEDTLSGIYATTYAEGMRLRFVPGAGSTGTLNVAYYAKSMG